MTYDIKILTSLSLNKNGIRPNVLYVEGLPSAMVPAEITALINRDLIVMKNGALHITMDGIIYLKEYYRYNRSLDFFPIVPPTKEETTQAINTAHSGMHMFKKSVNVLIKNDYFKFIFIGVIAGLIVSYFVFFFKWNK